MTNKEKCNTELIETMKNIVGNGFKCYVHEGQTWGFVVTPSDNVIYVQYGIYKGYTFSLQYIPSKNNGSGCGCLDRPVGTVDRTMILTAESAGLNFARKLNATLYKSSDKFFAKYWKPEALQEVTL